MTHPLRHLLVCYDIGSDDRRTALVNVLRDYGSRIQESVFECEVPAALADQLLKRLDDVVESDDGDVVHVFTLCGACMTDVRVFGAGRRVCHARFMVV